MKKIILSAFVVLGLVGYVAYQAIGGATSAATANAVVANVQTTPASTDTAANIGTSAQGAVVPTDNSGTSNGIPSVPTVAPVPVTKPKGQYINGTYTGSAVDAYYGIVQVSAVVKGGKLAKISLLQYPNDREQSQEISNRSFPILESEAIQSQSAQVDGVSGATQTSDAFTQSLGTALAKAKNS